MIEIIEIIFWSIFGWGVLVFWTGVLSSPVIYFGRRRAQWQLWELAAFIVPYWSWIVCNLIDDSGKSLVNMAIEPACLILAVLTAIVIRVAIGHPTWQRWASVVLVGAMGIVAVCLWAFVPAFPE